MEERLYDSAIIGCGPAGISAAINLRIRNKSFILFGGNFCSPDLNRAERVDNYPGFYGVTGEELRQKFLEHLKQMDITITEERVENIYNLEDGFSLMSGQETYRASSLILAIGVSNEKYLPGEEELVGSGVSYCATCDGPLYRDKKVAVIAKTEEGLEDAEYLAELAEKVYLLPSFEVDEILADNIIVIDSLPRKIRGESRVEELILADDVLKVDGIFIIREVTPPDKLLAGLEIEKNHIKVNGDMETSVPGVYAAGDCTGTPYQIARAVGQGQVAALNAVSWLRRMKKDS
ncbi:MAG: NAD(P)/FAD-dependent oxidoreductase [Halanaerobiaceae bacterium]